MPTNNPFLTQPVRLQLLSITFHSLIGMMSIVLFNLVDMWFISRLGLDELAALGYLGPVVLILISVLIGCELTASISLSERLGEADERGVRNVVIGILSYGLLLTTLLLVLGVSFASEVMSLLGADGNIAILGQEYLQIWLLSYPALAICMIGTSILRTAGKAKQAGLLLLVATLFNALLDPILIFGLGIIDAWGMQGAAWATVISRVACALLVLQSVDKHLLLRVYKLPKLEALCSLWKNNMGLASTITFNRLMIPCATAIATGYISRFGDASVAAFGVINVLQSLPIAFILALNSALIPFLRQNVSAGNIGRAAQSVQFALVFIVVWGCLQGGLFFVLSDAIAHYFTKDKNTSELLLFYYHFIPISMMGIGLFLVNNSVSYSFRQGRYVLKMNMIRVLFLYLPSVLIGGYLGSTQGVFIGLGVANVGMGIVAIISIQHHRRHGALKLA